VTLPVAGPVQRVAYLGTPEAAVPPLRALVAAGFDVPVVISRRDARRGRGSALTPSPVKAAALALGLPVADDLSALTDLDVDLAVVVAYGQLIPETTLDTLPFVNLHFSLLPRWRGAAPVERAILAGDPTTGVCLMALEPVLDTGPVYRRYETPIDPHETADALRNRLVVAGVDLLLSALRDGLGSPEPQQGEATYAAKIGSDERELNWAEPAEALERRVRVGGAFTFWNGRRLKVHAARTVAAGADGVVVPTVDGQLQLLELQPEGKPRMTATDWARGARWSPDERFGQ
jgi:methionyl-tRNA formyltransferase